VLYATCSPHLAETVGVVADAVRRHPVSALDARPLFQPVADLGDGPYVQLWPHRHGTDAMFAAVLAKVDVSGPRRAGGAPSADCAWISSASGGGVFPVNESRWF
jgi:hypothetical protein